MTTRLDVLKEIKKAAYLEGEFVTRAGKKTNYYIDKYLFETLPHILEPLAEEIAKLLPDPSTYDRLAAPELGSVPITSVVSIKVNKPFVIVRKKTKDYGTKRLIEGKINPGETVVVIEDILTTGGAVLQACDVLRDENVNILEIIGIINREEGAAENIAAKGLTHQNVFTKTELLSV
jgi:orotate phosphoribosyltransferase